MAKYYLRLLLLIGAVIGLFALIGTLLPRSYDFQSSVQVAAPAEAIYPLLVEPKRWQEWSRQWNPEEIEELTISYNSIPSGPGAAQTWTDRRGSGKLWIVDCQSPSSVEYRMTFAGFPEMASQFELRPDSEDPNRTEVVWSSQGRLPGGPFYGYFAPFFATQMRNEYDKSLARLKEQVESATANSDEPGGQ